MSQVENIYNEAVRISKRRKELQGDDEALAREFPEFARNKPNIFKGILKGDAKWWKTFRQFAESTQTIAQQLQTPNVNNRPPAPVTFQEHLPGK